MKTLSVKQPWAYLLCAGIKDIENRTWKLPEKHKDKWVLIHTSTHIRKSTKDLLNKEQFDVILGLSDFNKEKYFNGRQVEHAIIGAVKFSDCVIKHPSIWAGYIDNMDRVMFGFKKIYNWVVSEAIIFDNPILNVKGKLSFWDFDLPEEYVKLLK